MKWIIDLNWFAGPVLQITLLIFMARNQAHKAFPRFFSSILFQTLKSPCLFAVYRYSPKNYFVTYWTGNAISVIFAIAVMDEILRRLFRQYGGIQILGTTIFRWSCGLLFLLAVMGAVSGIEAGGDRVVMAVFTFDRSLRLMQVGLFLLLLLLCRVFKNCWREQVFGIALGFGVFASVELILISVVMWYGNSHAGLISLLKSTAYNAVTVVWIGYLRHEPQLLPAALAGASPRPLGMALATPDAMLDPDAGFMLRVEQAVDRVLSRSDWPRPASTGSRIVGRKPNPEEGN